MPHLYATTPPRTRRNIASGLDDGEGGSRGERGASGKDEGGAGQKAEARGGGARDRDSDYSHTPQSAMSPNIATPRTLSTGTKENKFRH